MNIKITKKFFSNFSFAIIGSGPGGFFTAKHILKKYPNSRIDFYEKLPHPFGLVRTGVAPDHQEVKNVEKDFTQLLEDKENRIRFFGNIEVGKDISFDLLSKHYSSIILAYGAESENLLGLKNENEYGCFSARKFVNWYNGHVLYSKNSEFNSIDFGSINDVVIIGNGNVAIDCARILSKNVDELKRFDIPESVLLKLANSKIKNIHIVARRGVPQGAFTLKELKELSRVNGSKIFVYKNEVDYSMNEQIVEEMKSLQPVERKILNKKMDFVKNLNHVSSEMNNEQFGNKNIFLRFLLTPKEIILNNSKKVVEGLKFSKTNCSGHKNNESNETEIINCSLILKSIGYKSIQLFNDLQFDPSTNTLKHKDGVLYDKNGNLCYNIFAVGWVKRGAKGVIDYTLRDSYETADSIFTALSHNLIKEKNPDYDSIFAEIKTKKIIVNFDLWKKIDAYELTDGKERNKLREKITDYEKMISIVNH